MDDTEDDAGYPPHPHHHRGNSSHVHKLPGRGFPGQDLPPPRLRYSRGQEDDGAEEDDDVEVSEAEEDPDQNEAEEDEDEQEGDENEDDEDEEDERPPRSERLPLKRRRKRRRLDRLALGFEFAPRAAAAAAAASTASAPSAPRPPARNSPADWSEDSTLVLLDAWGDLYLQNGRKSIRSEEWAEVARKVSQSSRTFRSETQCRNRLDTLKKKYKKEKMSNPSSSDWIYFSKMDSLMSVPPMAAARLPCGFDSGEYVFMSSKVYVSRSNDLDEMRDTPADSECEDDDDEDSEGLPPERSKSRKESSFRMLADSIQKFGEIYEKIEDSKRQHMVELERMRKEFHEDLELQKRQILERAQAEIAKLRQSSETDEEDEGNGQEQDEEAINDEDDEEIDVSLEEGSA